MTIEIKKEFDFYDLVENCWSGAIETLGAVERNDKEEDLMRLLSEVYCDEMPDLTEINDLLWFEDEWIFEMLDINEED